MLFSVAGTQFLPALPSDPFHFLGHNHHFLRQDFVDSPTPGPIPPNPLATPNPTLTQLPAFFLPVPGSELPSVAGESH